MRSYEVVLCAPRTMTMGKLIEILHEYPNGYIDETKTYTAEDKIYFTLGFVEE